MSRRGDIGCFSDWSRVAVPCAAMQAQGGSELDQRIAALEETVGIKLTVGCGASTAMATSRIWCGTSSRRRSSTCWNPPHAGCGAWKRFWTAFPNHRSAPCWPTSKLLPSMRSPHAHPRPGSPGTGRHRQRFPPQRSLTTAVLSSKRETHEHLCISPAGSGCTAAGCSRQRTQVRTRISHPDN